MLVKRYKCDKQLPGPYSIKTTPCLNEFWGPAYTGPIEEITCPFCGKKGTVVMYKREWQVEPDTVLAGNREINTDLVEKAPNLEPSRK